MFEIKFIFAGDSIVNEYIEEEEEEETFDDTQIEEEEMGIFGMLSQGNCEDEDAERLFGAGYYEDEY